MPISAHNIICIFRVDKTCRNGILQPWLGEKNNIMFTRVYKVVPFWKFTDDATSIKQNTFLVYNNELHQKPSMHPKKEQNTELV